MAEAKTIAGLVSTIIAVHNRPLLVRESIASVLSQTYRPIEIIVVDDGSSDDTPDVVEGMAQGYRHELRLIRQNNRGPGAARETGRKAAKGEFVQYLDSDDLLLPRKFELQVKGLNQEPSCQVSYGRTRCYRHGDVPKDVPCKRTGEHIRTMFPSFLQSRWWSTSTPLFRREVTDQAGPWTRLWNEEDWEYDCRVASMGGNLQYVPEFVSDTRRGQADQLSEGGHADCAKLMDRAEAHRLILGHAKRYGVDSGSTEMQHFARELFLLSRQCGAAGLGKESRMLFHLARVASPPDRQNGRDFVLYSKVANLIGWVWAGRLARVLDRARNAALR